MTWKQYNAGIRRLQAALGGGLRRFGRARGRPVHAASSLVSKQSITFFNYLDT